MSFGILNRQGEDLHNYETNTPGSLVYLSTVILCALLGGTHGRQVDAATGSDDSDIKASLGAFTLVYNIVEANYADPSIRTGLFMARPIASRELSPGRCTPWTHTQISSTRKRLSGSVKTRRASITAWA